MRTAVYLFTSLVLVFAITAVALAWMHLSHLRRYQGYHWFDLWGSHGVHSLDFAVLGGELVLVTMLTVTLWLGFSRRR